MHYMNRMCHIFNHGKPVIPVALLYHGEAEWSGGYMLDQKPARQLLEHQIDFDIVPSDVFAHMDEFDASFGSADENEVPAGDKLLEMCLQSTDRLIRLLLYLMLSTLQKQWHNFVPAPFCADLKCFLWIRFPKDFAIWKMTEKARSFWMPLSPVQSYRFASLAVTFRETDIPEVRIVPAFRRLRYYHYVQDNAHIYMFSNEDPSKTFVGDVYVAARGNMYGYDAMDNRLYSIDGETTENGTCLHLRLGAYESAVVVFDESGAPEDTIQSGKIQNMSAADNLLESGITVTGPWKISTCEAKQYPDFKFLAQLDRLHDIDAWPAISSGFIRYETEFEDKGTFLIIENAYEGVEVWVNDVNVGMAICPPYRFDISATLKEGKNSLRIEVATTLYRKGGQHGGWTESIQQSSGSDGAFGNCREAKLCHSPAI